MLRVELAVVLLCASIETQEASSFDYFLNTVDPVRLAGPRFESLAPGRGEELHADFGLSLAWIEERQQPDGSWAGEGEASDVRATALGVLALMADGCSTRQGPHKEPLARAIRWLRARQDTETRAFVMGGEPVAVEDQAFATLAVGEAYRLSKSPLIRTTVQRAAYWLIDLQREDGGWSTAADALRPELETTAWATRALSVAHAAGVQVPEEVLRRALLSLGPSLEPAVGPSASSENERAVRVVIASYVRLQAARRLGFDGQRAVLELNALELDGIIPSGRFERGIDPTFCVFGATASALALARHADLPRAGTRDRPWNGARDGHKLLWELAIASVPAALQRADGSFDPGDVGDPRGGRLEATALVVLWTAAVVGGG